MSFPGRFSIVSNQDGFFGRKDKWNDNEGIGRKILKSERIIEGDISWMLDSYGRVWHYLKGPFREICEQWYHEGDRNSVTGITTNYTLIYNESPERLEGMRFYKTFIGKIVNPQSNLFKEDDDLCICELESPIGKPSNFVI